MATNPPTGDVHRNGAIRGRSQIKTPSDQCVKRDTEMGRFMDVKTTDKNDQILRFLTLCAGANYFSQLVLDGLTPKSQLLLRKV